MFQRNRGVDEVLSWKHDLQQVEKIKSGAGELPSRILREFVLTIPAIKHLQVSIWPLIA